MLCCSILCPLRLLSEGLWGSSGFVSRRRNLFLLCSFLGISCFYLKFFKSFIKYRLGTSKISSSFLLKTFALKFSKTLCCPLYLDPILLTNCLTLSSNSPKLSPRSYKVNVNPDKMLYNQKTYFLNNDYKGKKLVF